MTVGQKVLIKILEDNKPDVLVILQRNWFQLEYELPIYDAIMKYYTQYGILPPEKLIKDGFKIEEKVEGELGFWIEEFNKRRFLLTYDEAIGKISPLVVQGDTAKANEELCALSSRLSDINKGDEPVVTHTEMFDGVINELTTRREKRGIVGIPTGWDALTLMLRGFSTGLYVVAGRKKMGKTQVMLRMSKTAHDAFNSTLVVSMEMSKEEWGNRMLSIYSGVGLNFIASGMVSSPVQEALYLVRGVEESQNGALYYFKEGFFNITTAEIGHLIISLRPKIVFLDGAYLVRATGNTSKMAGWERVTEVVKELKLLSGRYHIPIVCSYQYNREGQIHLSDAIAQIATAVIGVYESPDRSDIRVLRVTDNRNGPRGEVIINWDFNRVDFSQLSSEDESYINYFYEASQERDEND